MPFTNATEMEVVGLEVVHQFIEAVAGTYVHNRVFRGHASAAWKPVPSALRPEMAGITEEQHLTAWKRTASRFVSPKPGNDVEFLVLAQHYGIPTALLDWTANPLVALFFACQHFEETKGGNSERTDGAVIQLNTDTLRTIKKNPSVDVFNTNREAPLLIDTTAMNARTLAQDSVMTLHTEGEPALNVTQVFVVPENRKAYVKIALRLFGISEERIYADLGVAASNFRDGLEAAYNWKRLSEMVERSGALKKGPNRSAF